MELNSHVIDDRNNMESVLDFEFDESNGCTPSLRRTGDAARESRE